MSGSRAGLRLAALSVGAVAVFILVPASALARAGGGGGAGGGAGGIAGLILLPFFVIYSAIVSAMLASKNRQSRALMKRLEAIDRTWDMERIQRRVEMTFFKVQEAWTQRDQGIAKSYMSERLYEKHKLQTDQMISSGRRNVLDRINLKQAQVVGVKDFRDDSRDRFWMHIEGSMIDYMVDDATGQVTSGDSSKPESFTEIWMFVRGETDWVLDEINQNAGLSQIQSLDCFTESIPGDA